MESVNLDQILNADEEALKEKQNVFFEYLKTFNSEEVNSINDFRRIFEAMQKVVRFRDQQQEEEINTLKEKLKIYQEADRLKLSQQLWETERNMMLNRFGKRRSSTLNLLKMDPYEMEEHIQDLREENDELQKVITKEKQISEKYNKQILQLRKEISEFKEEKQRLKENFTKYQRQLQTQWDYQIGNMEEIHICTEPIHSLELQLLETTKSIENMMAKFKSKKNECYRLNLELKEAMKSLSNSKMNNFNLETILQCEDISNKMLTAMNDELKSKILSLENEKKSRDESDDAIMNSLNEKVAEWKKLLGSKEEKIISLQDTIFDLRKQLRIYHENIPDTSSIQSFNKKLREKDAEISRLEEKITFLTEMRKKHVESIKNIENLFRMKTMNLREEIEKEKTFREWIEKELKDAQAFANQAKNDALEKDKCLCETLKRLHQYEKNYGFDEAMQEIKNLQQQVEIRDRRIKELTVILTK